MKPIYSIVLRRGGKEHVLRFPLTQRRIDRADAALGFGRYYDPDGGELSVVEYRSQIGAPPDVHVEHEIVDQTAKLISNFAPAQITAMKSFCGAFNLSFEEVTELAEYLSEKNAAEGCAAGSGYEGE